LTRVPAGFARQPDSVGDTGPSDLAKAIRDDRQPDAAQALKDERFVQGYQRLWMNPARAQIIVFIYQFASPAGARASYERQSRLITREAGASFTRFVIPGLPTKSSTAGMAQISGHAGAVADSSTGHFTMQVICYATSAAGLKARLVAMAREQYAKF
jgi:hypothetical protein